jgi:hypothetical protein
VIGYHLLSGARLAGGFYFCGSDTNSQREDPDCELARDKEELNTAPANNVLYSIFVVFVSSMWSILRDAENSEFGNFVREDGDTVKWVK